MRAHRPPRADLYSFQREVEASERALAVGNIAYFGKTVPQRESWRVYREYYEFAAYIDIESTGSAHATDAITCIAVATRRGMNTYVRGRNLEGFPDAVRDYPMIVTFNGGSFDLPILRRTFGEDIFSGHAHFDVCVALRRLGHRGGLKALEKYLGVPRDEGLDGVDGASAVLLWNLHRGGDRRALETLERYCVEDVLGLPAIAAIASNALLSETPFAKELPELQVPRRVNCYMPFSRNLVNEIRLRRIQEAAELWSP